MTEDHIGQLREQLPRLGLQRHLVVHHHARGIITGVAPDPVAHGGAPVTGMVIGHHDETLVHQRGDQPQVAPRVLAQAVDQLHHRPRLPHRGVHPRLDGIAPIAGRELDLLQRHADLLVASPPDSSVLV